MSPLRHKQGFELLQNWMGGDWGFFVVVIFVSFFFYICNGFTET